MNDLVLAACVFVAISVVVLLVKGTAVATALSKKIVKLGAGYPVPLEQVVIRIQVEEDWRKQSKRLQEARLKKIGGLTPAGGIFGGRAELVCEMDRIIDPPTVTSMIFEVDKNAERIELWPHGVEVQNQGRVVGYAIDAMESYRKLPSKGSKA